jgi:hypothetical protein
VGNPRDMLSSVVGLDHHDISSRIHENDDAGIVEWVARASVHRIGRLGAHSPIEYHA